MIDIAARWREFETDVDARGLGWGLHHAPAQLRWARRGEYPLGADVAHLLPADYRAFVADVGYPVLGFGYYDREGISFLPPEAMGALSVYLPDTDDNWPEAVDGRPTRCLFAFFAGYDLSDYEGYAFGPAEGGDGGGDGGGEPVVWEIERGMPTEALGTFTEWLDKEIARQRARIASLDADEVAEMREENKGEDDPHRLIDYSLGGSYDQPPFTADDMALSWVESEDTDPYSFGLIDAAGTWRIPLGPRYRRVRPFRDGVAEVVRNDGTTGYDGPWTRIDPDGREVGS